jgi:Icc-related predicted phosphoesterase
MAIRAALEESGVRVLEGEAAVCTAGGVRVAVAGVKGFGSGFAGACGTEFGEVEMKAFVQRARESGALLGTALAGTGADLHVALMHYAPIKDTLAGERPEIYPFLGSFFLAAAIDGAPCDLAIHGHAHHGTEWGLTPGGVPVRNVARPVIRRPYKVYELDPEAAEGSRLRQ